MKSDSRFPFQGSGLTVYQRENNLIFSMNSVTALHQKNKSTIDK